MKNMVNILPAKHEHVSIVIVNMQPYWRQHLAQCFVELKAVLHRAADLAEWRHFQMEGIGKLFEITEWLQ